MSQEKQNATRERTVTIRLEYQLYDWSETLTYDEISSTLLLIGSFLDKTATFSKPDEKIIKLWLKKNSIEKFLNAKDNAHEEMLKNELEELYVKDIMSYPYKRPRSH